jgi:5-hydroxyisourate hydrolase
MGRLTTHVLDTASGKPAAGLKVELYRVGKDEQPVASAKTNADGRMDEPLLEGAAFTAGIYELRFHVGDYLRQGARLADPLFLDVVPVRFGVSAADEHHHVPLLLSPHGYTTYRGS